MSDSSDADSLAASGGAPRVTVVMPAFNAARFIRDAVASVLEQTYDDFELLVVDDGSTDGTRQVLAEFPDPRLRVIVNPANAGIVHSRNRAIRLARGSYLALLDADDIAEPDRLRMQVEFMDANPEVALLGGHAALIDERGRAFGKMTPPTAPSEILERMYTVNCFVCSTVMVRTSVAIAHGGFREQAQYVEDYDLWLRIIGQHEVANLGHPLVRYRIHPDQVSQTRLAVARQRADNVRLEAYENAKRTRGLPDGVDARRLSAWQRWRGTAPSVGSDLRSWSNTYFLMGRRREARKLLLLAVRSAPLFAAAYLELLFPDVARGETWYRITNTLSWYRKRVRESIRLR